MPNSAKQISAAAILGLAVCAFTGADVGGQTRPRQTGLGSTVRALPSNLTQTASLQQALLATALGLNPYAGLGNFAGLGSAFAGGVNPYAGLSSIPYGEAGQGAGLYGGSPGLGQYASPYGNPYSTYYQDPNGAYLQSAGSVINAQARFLVSEQLAYQTREQTRGDRTANRRKAFDEYVYERDKRPTAEEERQKAQLTQLSRSRNNPPVTEIWSGKALNDLLNDLRQLPASNDLAIRHTLPLPLHEAGLKHINVTKGGGSIALLKDDGRFDWPVALAGPESEAERDQLALRSRAAVRQAEFNGRVDPGLLRQIAGDVDELDKHLRLRVKELSASEYIEAKTFLQHFDEALRALRQPDVGNHFTGKYVLNAETVPELVQQMVDKGLHFAPALPRDEAAYRALHQALATYDRDAHPVATPR